MIGGEAEATQIPARCSSFGGVVAAGLYLQSCWAPGWEVACARSRHVPARAAIGSAGHNWLGGQAAGQGCGVDFSLSAEQRELTEAATAFARRELNQDLVKREDAGEFPREAWRKCARFGVQGLPVPAELGGAGADILTTALVMEALGYGCQDNGLLFSLNAQMWSVRAAAGDVRHPGAAAGVPARDGVGGLDRRARDDRAWLRFRRAAHAHPRRAAR